MGLLMPSLCMKICTGGTILLDDARRYNECYNMTMKTKVRKIGNSYGIVLPREALQQMMVKEGDVLYLTEAPEQSLRITAEKASFDDMMKIADQGMMKYRNALRELAK